MYKYSLTRHTSYASMAPHSTNTGQTAMLTLDQRKALAKAPKHYRKRIMDLLNAARYSLKCQYTRTARNLIVEARKLMQQAIDSTLPVRLKFHSKVLRVIKHNEGYLVQLSNGAEVVGRNVRQCEQRIKEALA